MTFGELIGQYLRQNRQTYQQFADRCHVSKAYISMLVNGKNPKTGALKNRASDRHVPVPAPLRAILQPLRGLPDTYIAHAPSGPDRPLSKSSADRLWLRLMAAAGMVVAPPEDDDKYEQYDPRHNLRPLITPHALRHNYITMCWEHGFDPYETMKLVGHASIATTMNIYTHLSEAQMSKTAAKLDDMFAVPKVAQKLH